MTSVRGQATKSSYSMDTDKLRRLLKTEGPPSAPFVMCLCDYIDFLVKELEYARARAVSS